MGIITEVHPILACHEDCCMEVEGYLALCKIPENDFAMEWIKIHMSKKHKGVTYAPEFKLVPTTVKWEDNNTKIETAASKVLCTKKDGFYLKTLLATAFSYNNKTRGTFFQQKHTW
eukprot:13190435-Ditylum_brightwellii.AAC.1